MSPVFNPKIYQAHRRPPKDAPPVRPSCPASPWFEDDASPLYSGEWFELSGSNMTICSTFCTALHAAGCSRCVILTDRITSVFYELNVDGHVRYFHAFAILPRRVRPTTCATPLSARDPTGLGDDVRNGSSISGRDPR